MVIVDQLGGIRRTRAHRVLEEFVRNERPVLHGILDFLGVDPDVEIGSGAEASNPRAAPRNRVVGRLLGSRFERGVARNIVPLALQPRIEEWLLKPAPRVEMEPEARRILSTLFAPDVERLRDLVGRPIPWGSVSVSAEHEGQRAE